MCHAHTEECRGSTDCFGSAFGLSEGTQQRACQPLRARAEPVSPRSSGSSGWSAPVCLRDHRTFAALSRNWVCGIATVFCTAFSVGTCPSYHAGIMNAVCCTTGGSPLCRWSEPESEASQLLDWDCRTCYCVLTVTSTSLSMSWTCACGTLLNLPNKTIDRPVDVPQL